MVDLELVIQKSDRNSLDIHLNVHFLIKKNKSLLSLQKKQRLDEGIVQIGKASG